MGKVGTAPLWQIAKLVPKGNVGVVLAITFIVIEMGKPHWFALGVNVYVPEVRLLTVAGLQVPDIPLLETAGNVGAVVPAQKGAIGVNVGTNMGSDKIIPVKRFVVHPFTSNAKLE